MYTYCTDLEGDQEITPLHPHPKKKLTNTFIILQTVKLISGQKFWICTQHKNENNLITKKLYLL